MRGINNQLHVDYEEGRKLIMAQLTGLGYCVDVVRIKKGREILEYKRIPGKIMNSSLEKFIMGDS